METRSKTKMKVIGRKCKVDKKKPIIEDKILKKGSKTKTLIESSFNWKTPLIAGLMITTLATSVYLVARPKPILDPEVQFKYSVGDTVKIHVNGWRRSYLVEFKIKKKVTRYVVPRRNPYVITPPEICIGPYYIGNGGRIYSEKKLEKVIVKPFSEKVKEAVFAPISKFKNICLNIQNQPSIIKRDSTDATVQNILQFIGTVLKVPLMFLGVLVMILVGLWPVTLGVIGVALIVTLINSITTSTTSTGGSVKHTNQNSSNSSKSNDQRERPSYVTGMIERQQRTVERWQERNNERIEREINKGTEPYRMGGGSDNSD